MRNSIRFAFQALKHGVTPKRLAQVEKLILSKLKSNDLDSASMIINKFYGFLATNCEYGNLANLKLIRPISLKHTEDQDPFLIQARSMVSGVNYSSNFRQGTRTHLLILKRLLAYHQLISKLPYTTEPQSIPLYCGDSCELDQIAIVGCSNRTNHILIPDSEFISSKGYSAFRLWALKFTRPWIERKNVIFWRGGVNCFASREDLWIENPRIRLAMTMRDLSVGIKTDCKVVGVNFIYKNPAIQNSIQKQNIIDDPIPLRDFSNYKYLIDIDGYSNAWSSLFTKLVMGALVIKVESERGYKQWYYDRLVPFIHYIPVRPDLLDLHEKIEWIENNQTKCNEIAMAGSRLAHELKFPIEIDKSAESVSRLIIESKITKILLS